MKRDGIDDIDGIDDLLNRLEELERPSLWRDPEFMGGLVALALVGAAFIIMLMVWLDIAI